MTHRLYVHIVHLKLRRHITVFVIVEHVNFTIRLPRSLIRECYIYLDLHK